MKLSSIKPLFLVFAALLAPALYAEQGRVAIALHDARDVIDGQLSGQDFVYFGREFDLSQAAGQRLLPFDELITRITRLAPEEALASALEKLTERIRTGSVVAPRALVLAALEQAHDLLVERHEQISSDDELRDLHSQLTLYKTAIEEDALTIAVSSEMREYGALAPTRTAGEGGSGSDASEYRLPEQGALDNGGLSVEVDGKPAVLADLIKVTRGSSFSISPGTNTATFNLAGGNVSVDTSAPSAAITINQDLQTGAAVTFDSVTSASGATADLSLDSGNTSYGVTIGGTTANAIHLGPNTFTITDTPVAIALSSGTLIKSYDQGGGTLSPYIHNRGFSGTTAPYTPNYNFFAGINAGYTLAGTNSATHAVNNTGIGESALYNLTTGATAGQASENTAVGYQAGTAISTGSQNTLLGSKAGTAITSGNYNTAVGWIALGAETTGNKSTAIGMDALNNQDGGGSVTVDMSNTAVGYEAGWAISTGKYNTAVGVVALGNDGQETRLTGSNNTALGYGALTTAQGIAAANTCVGSSAGGGITTAQYNTLVGSSAGAGITTAGYNTVVGQGSLMGTSGVPGGENVAVGVNIGNWLTGTQNVLLGNGAATYISTGNYNTAVGYQALQSNGTNYLTSSGSTAVGYQAGMALTTGSVTAVGYQAGMALTGGNVTAVGSGAAKSMTTGYNNTAIGANALAAETTGLRSTAVGISALGQQNSTTVGFLDNTAVGDSAGYAITTGDLNVAIGAAALGCSTPGQVLTGGHNTAVGYDAGGTLQGAASENVLIGYSAGYSMTATNQNTAVGSQALFTETTGLNSTAVGFGALYSQKQTGSTSMDNTAVGTQAGQYISTGAQNTAIGSGAMYGNSTPSLNLIGTGNTAVGYHAGYALQSGGAQNTLIGSGAAIGLTTGSTNTLIGQAVAGNLTTGQNNICIGWTAGNAIAAGTNNIHIGISGSADESSTTRIANIYATAGSGNTVLVTSTGQLVGPSSSRRYKDNIAPLTAEDRFMQLQPVSFTYKSDGERRVQYGLIAEQVNECYPELVLRNNAGEIDAIAYNLLDGIMIREIQQNRNLIAELQAANTAQDTQLNSLQALIATMAARIAALEAHTAA